MAQVRENIAQSELDSGVVNTPVRKHVTDLDHAGGDTGAMQVFASLRDANVVLDGPVGCHVMPAVAVINYTDAVPYLQNVTCSELSETEVTLAGTLGVLKEKVAHAEADGRQVFIVSTPVSELIGATWTTERARAALGAVLRFALARRRRVEVARPRAAVPVAKSRALRRARGHAGEPVAPATALVNIIGPTYGNFNSYSDLAEIKRLVAGIGADVNLVYPFEANSYDTARLADAGATIVMYAEYGGSLAREVGLPAFSAPIGLEPTTAFLRGLGAALGLKPKPMRSSASRRRRRSPHGTISGARRTATSSPTRRSRSSPRRPTSTACRYYLGEELGLPIAFSAYRTGPESAPSEDVRRALRDLSPSPMIVFGSINERMIVAQEKMPSLFLQCSFPGAVVRRATGTPFVGYAGAVWLLQCVCEALFDVLFANLPTSAAPPEQALVPTRDLMHDAPPSRRHRKGQSSVIAWTTTRRRRRADAQARAVLRPRLGR